MNVNEMAAELVQLAGSQTAAADASGVSQATISKLLTGAANQDGVKLATISGIKKALTRLRRKKRG